MALYRERLVRYYERLGLRRWKAKTQDPKAQVVMFHQAIHSLPFLADAE